MIKLFRTTFFLLSFLTTASVIAQDDLRAAWQVLRFDINATASLPERALNARATLSLRNVGRGPATTVSLRISPGAEIRSATINGASATFRTAEDRGNLQRITLTSPTSISPDATATVVVDYKYNVPENSGLASISPLGSQFLPLAFWYPVPNSPVLARGFDTAPTRITVTSAGGETFVASGRSNGAAFDQPISAQPMFVSGSWDVVDGSGDSAQISAWLLKGSSAEEKKQAEALMRVAAAARSFFSSSLGSAPDVPIRLVAVTRGSGVSEGGTILLDAAAFRRPKPDANTVALVADGVARLWIGSKAAIRGEGAGVVREGLNRYLSNLFIEKEFGQESAEAELLRQRLAHAGIAKRDAPMGFSTPRDDTYFLSVANKGAMIWRLIERDAGRSQLLAVIKRAVDDGTLELSALRNGLYDRTKPEISALFSWALEQPTDMDLLVGLPQQRGSELVSALRNTGSIDAVVNVLATTASGEKVRVTVRVPARNFGEAVFKSSSKILRVEVDPEKFYPQTDYSNDIVPHPQSTNAIAEAVRLYARLDYSKAERLARDLLLTYPLIQELKVLIARSLLAQGRIDQAESEFRRLLEERLPLAATMAWAHVGLAEIAMQKGQTAEAARLYDQAVRIDGEYASTFAARAGRIKAESAANAAPVVDQSARSFITQLDQAIRSGRKAEIDALLLSGELASFSKGIVGAQPELWETRVLRSEQWDANRLALDVALNIKQFEQGQSGTAVFILARVGGGWKLGGIEFFEVR